MFVRLSYRVPGWPLTDGAVLRLRARIRCCRYFQVSIVRHFHFHCPLIPTACYTSFGNFVILLACQDESGSLERPEIVRALIKSVPEINGLDEDWLLGAFSAIWYIIDPNQDGEICCVDMVVWVAYFQARKPIHDTVVAVQTLPGAYVDLACCSNRGFPD